VKRTLLAMVALGIVSASGWAALRPGRDVSHDSPRDASPSVRSADVRPPAQFRQCQPRHWRYVMLSQNH
jgi:hypothetical protein